VVPATLEGLLDAILSAAAANVFATFVATPRR
jgi:hypothetical protein